MSSFILLSSETPRFRSARVLKGSALSSDHSQAPLSQPWHIGLPTLPAKFAHARTNGGEVEQSEVIGRGDVSRRNATLA